VAKKTEGLAVAGNVQFDSRPLPTGTITLSNGEISTSTQIDAGSFSIQNDQALIPGKYQVLVVSFEPTGRQIADSDWPGKTIAEAR